MAATIKIAKLLSLIATALPTLLKPANPIEFFQANKHSTEEKSIREYREGLLLHSPYLVNLIPTGPEETNQILYAFAYLSARCISPKLLSVQGHDQ